MANADCVKIYTCDWQNPGCTTDAAGGCCTRKCITDSAAPQAAVNLYLDFDKCVYCTTCKTICTEPMGIVNATEYCAVLDAPNPNCP